MGAKAETENQIEDENSDDKAEIDTLFISCNTIQQEKHICMEISGQQPSFICFSTYEITINCSMFCAI